MNYISSLVRCRTNAVKKGTYTRYLYVVYVLISMKGRVQCTGFAVNTINQNEGKHMYMPSVNISNISHVVAFAEGMS